MAEGVTRALFEAVNNGDPGAVAALLIAHPYLLESQDPMGCTPLLAAVKNGNLEVMCACMEQGATVFTCDSAEWTPLTWAAHLGHEEIVWLLLETGADTQWVDIHGETAMIKAVGAGHVTIVQRLLHHTPRGCVDAKDKRGRTALWWACEYGHLDIVRTLLFAGANHNERAGDNVSPAMQADHRDHTGIVALLDVSRGAQGGGEAKRQSHMCCPCHSRRLMCSNVCVAVVGGRGDAWLWDL